jgi:endonuclease/exonuclease/phosphatase family metal-dependent hydrolase
VLERWGLVIESGRAIVAGDLNASYQGPSSRQNRINIDKVHELGAVSAVHAHQGIEHGADNEPPTLRWIGRGGTPSFFHCDYIFVSQRLASRVVDVSVGAPAVWIESGRSDHCPLTVDLELAPP